MMGLGVIIFLTFWCFPIMVVQDGCDCGLRRTWYEMPDSPWRGAELFMRTENVGSPSHAHRLWDAQWGVWLDLFGKW
jgi:hypothetical protein